MLKIYDCSNSSESPIHSSYFGSTKENSVVSILKKYASQFNACFVENIADTDVIFTNDIFPQEVIKLQLPKVKRMDGVYWIKEMTQKSGGGIGMGTMGK